MSESGNHDGSNEVPVRFRVHREALFGILTLPRSRQRRIGIILLNAGGTPSIDRTRLWVTLSRQLAISGFPVLRFDYHGSGESSGTNVKMRINQPYTQDVIGAVEELRRRGVDEVILVGRCFGSRVAVSAAGRVPGLRGLVLIGMPLLDHGWSKDRIHPRMVFELLDPRRRRSTLRVIYRQVRKWGQRPWALLRLGRWNEIVWISPTVEKGLRRAMAERVPLLLMYGEDDDAYQEFLQAQKGAFGTLLASSGHRTRVVVQPGDVHLLTTLRGQQAIATCIQEWLDAVSGSAPEAWPDSTERGEGSWLTWTARSQSRHPR